MLVFPGKQIGFFFDMITISSTCLLIYKHLFIVRLDVVRELTQFNNFTLPQHELRDVEKHFEKV